MLTYAQTSEGQLSQLSPMQTNQFWILTHNLNTTLYQGVKEMISQVGQNHQRSDINSLLGYEWSAEWEKKLSSIYWFLCSMEWNSI